jgi:hypothetical protein
LTKEYFRPEFAIPTRRHNFTRNTKNLLKVLNKPPIINLAENNDAHRQQVVNLYQFDMGCLVTFIKLERKTSERSFWSVVTRLGNYLAVYIGLVGDYSQQGSVFALSIPRIL